MNTPNPRLNFFFKKEKKWHDELTELRKLVLDCGLKEELKWGVPCYTFEGRNVVLIHGFKEYCALLFMNGALLKDPKKILIQQTKNVQAGRQIRFTSVKEIVKSKTTLQAYIKEAIKVEKLELKIKYKKTAEYDVPAEFQTELSKNHALKTAFEALTPGRQRGYILYFSAPKLSATRKARIEKNTDKILDGIGLNDR